MSEIRIVERDYKIIKEIDRWRVCQGRHIQYLAEFEGQRACDRRLRKLIEAGYIKRKKILYGVAGIYSNTNKAKLITEIGNINQQIKVEQIKHDIAVLDTAIYFNKKYGIKFNQIITEMELHRKDGFGVRKHRPDFIYIADDKKTCVEVELTLKSKTRFEQNIKSNFIEYDNQIWVVPNLNTKIAEVLNKKADELGNIKIIELEEVQEFVRENK